LRGTFLTEVGRPSWSPDGSSLAFAETASCVHGCSSIYTVNADGTGLRRITRPGNQWSPAWSPDGSRIAFLFNQGAATVRPDGSGLVSLPLPYGVGLPMLVWNSSSAPVSPLLVPIPPSSTGSHAVEIGPCQIRHLQFSITNRGSKRANPNSVEISMRNMGP